MANCLIEDACTSLSADLEFVKTFLYTYQSFSTPERLLKKLIERYNVVRPEGMSLKAFSVMKQTIQARVINAFKLWVDLSADFKGVYKCTPFKDVHVLVVMKVATIILLKLYGL